MYKIENRKKYTKLQNQKIGVTSKPIFKGNIDKIEIQKEFIYFEDKKLEQLKMQSNILNEENDQIKKKMKSF